jgi:uncharacterized repeat protein (TIGR01451 family)
MFDIDRTYLIYSNAGSSLNSYSVNDTMPAQYRTYLSNMSIIICLNELRLKICAESQQQAEEIVQKLPWIYRTSNSLNVTIIEPKQGENLTLGDETTIKVKVNGANGGERYCYVWGKSNKSTQVWRLTDNGQDGEGVYATTWIPDATGETRIAVTALNCAISGTSKIDLMVNKGEAEEDQWVAVFKHYEPQVLDASTMDKENGSTIKYTIKIVPIGGIKLQNVKIIENLPNYIFLNNNSVRDRGKITENNDGKKWSTTNVTWDIGDIITSRSISFEGSFKWKIPANAQHIEGAPLPMSFVTFRDNDGNKKTELIPEGELTFVLSD